MSKNSSGKGRVVIYALLTLAGCVLACSSIISNDYVKFLLVIVTLCVGLYGLMRGLSSSSSDREELPTTEE